MKKIIKNLMVLVTSLSLTAVFAFAGPVHAEDVFNDVCTKAPNSTVCQSKNPGSNPITGPNGILTLVISIISIIVGIASVIAIIFAGAKFISSGSNPQEVARAREAIVYAIIGLVIALLAQAIVQFFLKDIN